MAGKPICDGMRIDQAHERLLNCQIYDWIQRKIEAYHVDINLFIDFVRNELKTKSDRMKSLNELSQQFNGSDELVGKEFNEYCLKLRKERKTQIYSLIQCFFQENKMKIEDVKLDYLVKNYGDWFHYINF